MFSPSDLSQSSSQITFNGPNGVGNPSAMNGGFNASGINNSSNFNSANGAFSNSNSMAGMNNGNTNNGFGSSSNTNIAMHTNPNINFAQKNPQSPALDNIFPLFPLVGSFTLDENGGFSDNKNNNMGQMNNAGSIPAQSSTAFSNPSQANSSSVLTSPTGGSFTPATNMGQNGFTGTGPQQPKPVYAGGTTNGQYYAQNHRPRRPESVLSVTSNSSTATNQLAAYPPSASGGAHHLGINRNNSILSFDSLPVQHHPKSQKKVVHHHEIPIKELNDDVIGVLSRSHSVEPGYGTTLPLAPSVPSLTDVAALTLLSQSQLGMNGTKLSDANDVLFDYDNPSIVNSINNSNDLINGNNTEMMTSGSNGIYDANGKLSNGSNLFSYEDYAPMLEGINDLMSPVFGGNEGTEFMG